MSLEALYNNASANTYVGTVRARQSADASATGTPLVNFLDGDRRSGVAADVFQREFTRNPAGYGITGGVPKHPSGNLTRWTPKAFKLAFDGEGPISLNRGYYTEQFRTARSGQLVHNYTPAVGNKFGERNSSAATRLAASPSGAPAGF
jgi:hypothetical protein